MNSFSALFRKNKCTLIASLPSNHPLFVAAAIKGGADAIKVHMNIHHRASAHMFGGLSENRNTFEQIRHAYDVPIGIVPGDAYEKVKQSEINGLEEIGFDFVSLYLQATPAWLFTNTSMAKMIALGNGYTKVDIDVFNRLPVDALEASIVHPDHYGKPLTVQDVSHYGALVERTRKPVVVPTQKNIHPEEVNVLTQVGVSAIMIGAIVTGLTEQSIYEATRAFRSAIDQQEVKGVST